LRLVVNYSRFPLLVKSDFPPNWTEKLPLVN
jgi:hypothetical protein